MEMLGNNINKKLTSKNSEGDKSPKEKADTNKGGEVTLDRIRTYKDAVKEALKSDNVSGAKILMAEQRKRSQYKEEEALTSLKTPKNKIFLVSSIVLIFVTIGIVSFVFYEKNQSQNELSSSGPKQTLKSTFFEPDGTIETASSQLTRNTILKIQQVLSSQLPSGTIQQIVLTKEVKADPDSYLNITKTVPYTTEDFLALIEARLSSTAKKSLDPEFFLGIQALESGNEPFIIFKVNNFNNVYSGMFDWERTLTVDISSVFFRNLFLLNQSSTALDIQNETSTKPLYDPRDFTDRVIGNTDARLIMNEKDQLLYFYTFIDEEYLYFGTNTLTFKEVRDRIRSAKLVL
jgi:hypothetical protein